MKLLDGTIMKSKAPIVQNKYNRPKRCLKERKSVKGEEKEVATLRIIPAILKYV